MKVNDIRKSFLSYFEKQNHLRVASASLIPIGDASLLFTTAGMVPFKDYFSALRQPPASRLTSVQKCLRTTDLSEVGKTQRHLSLFEMLGNFSFDDYFKKEAIEFAWDFSTNYLPFKKDDIWISIFQDDDEAFEIWNKHIGIDAEKIVRLGEADNFWGPAGTTGACGPCSELYLDRGIEYGCKTKECQPGCDCDRFMEFWNLVFNQFNKTENGEFENLKSKGIDTGAGLERLAALVQNVDSVYDTDELAHLRNRISEIYGVSYEGENVQAIRVLTDHARTLTFAMADGIFPSNESRGYVLRRVLRRALLFGRKINQSEPLLYKMVETVTNVYKEHYPELVQAENLTTEYIRREEERFLKTLAAGEKLLEEVLIKAESKGKIISGKDAFILYDTYGFPLEMTEEMAGLRGFRVDREQFDTEMAKQRERGRNAFKVSEENLPVNADLKTTFTGFKELQGHSKILQLVQESESVQNVSEDGQNTFYLVAESTPFYAEAGGQQGDSGLIRNKNGSAEVIDTQKFHDVYVHICQNLEGQFSTGDEIEMAVNEKRRTGLMSHHSATHLLNAALKKTLGEHITQSGSLVEPGALRFDFTHPGALQREQLEEVERLVNGAIVSSFKVDTEVLPIEEAKSKGAVMTFGEKYGDVVRIVTMGEGDSPFSKEFCGGTHVANTADIKFFLVNREGSPGAGNRRIEAYTADAAYGLVEEQKNQAIERLDALLKKSETEKTLHHDIEKLLKELKNLSVKKDDARASLDIWQKLRNSSVMIADFEKKVKKLEKRASKSEFELDEKMVRGLIAGKSKNAVIEAVLQGLPIPALLTLADAIREKDGDALILLASHDTQRWNAVFATTKARAEAVDIDLGACFKSAASEANLAGGGGGKKELAQGSGKASPSIEADLKTFLQLAAAKISAADK